jgi:hypothetical protein
LFCLRERGGGGLVWQIVHVTLRNILLAVGGGLGDLPLKTDTLYYLNPLLKEYFLLRSFCTRGDLGGPGHPDRNILS